MKKLIFLATVLVLASCDFAVKNNTFDDVEKVAFVYGVNDYSGYYNNISTGFRDLDFPVNDAVSIGSLLENSGFTVHKRLADEGGAGETTTENLPNREQLLDDLLQVKALSSNAIAVFFYAGHGGVDYNEKKDSAPYSVNSNSEVLYTHYDETKTKLETHYIYDFEIYKQMEDISAHVVFILDSCNSGGFRSSRPVFDANDSKAFNLALAGSIFDDKKSSTNDFAYKFYTSYSKLSSADKISNSKKFILAAASEKNLSWEPYEEEKYGLNSKYFHGYYTMTVMDAFQNGDYNKDGYITVSEIAEYTSLNLQKKINYFYDSLYTVKPISKPTENYATSDAASYDIIVGKKVENAEVFYVY